MATIISFVTVQSVFTIVYLFVFIVQVDSTFSTSSAKMRRTQSMRPLVGRTEITHIERAASPPHSSPSSSSSISSINSAMFKETNEAASSSSAFKEVNLEHGTTVVEKTKRVGFAAIGEVNLEEAYETTYSGANLNPERDSVGARIRLILQYGSLAAAATALAGTGFAAGWSLNLRNFSNNSLSTMNNTKINSTDVDEIINRI